VFEVLIARHPVGSPRFLSSIASASNDVELADLTKELLPSLNSLLSSPSNVVRTKTVGTIHRLFDPIQFEYSDVQAETMCRLIASLSILNESQALLLGGRL
jgi:hypothetical protein